MSRSRGFVIIGAILVVLGLLALASPYFTTKQQKEVAKIGDLKLQTTEETTHFVPPLVSGGVLLLGAVLIGAGLMRR